MTNRPLAASAFVILLSLLVLSACIAGSSATDWAFGEALTVRVKEVRLVDEVAYSINEFSDYSADALWSDAHLTLPSPNGALDSIPNATIGQVFQFSNTTTGATALPGASGSYTGVGARISQNQYVLAYEDNLWYGTDGNNWTRVTSSDDLPIGYPIITDGNWAVNPGVYIGRYNNSRKFTNGPPLDTTHDETLNLVVLLLMSPKDADGIATQSWYAKFELNPKTNQRSYAEDKHYVVRPSQEGRMIAAAHLEMRNRQANIVFLSIDAQSARLRDAEFFDYRPLNPFQDRTEVDRAPSSDGSPLPVPYVFIGDESAPDPKARLLWGDGSPNAPAVELHKNCGQDACQLVGWMFFEVPSDIEYYQFIWETADTIFLRF